MRQVIDRKRYDTETAEQVHEWSVGRPGDFEWRSKELYRTPKGSWFILHQGGARSDMAVSVGTNAVSGSSNIDPVSDDEALQFLESHDGPAEVIEQYFGEHIQDA